MNVRKDRVNLIDWFRLGWAGTAFIITTSVGANLAAEELQSVVIGDEAIISDAPVDLRDEYIIGDGPRGLAGGIAPAPGPISPEILGEESIAESLNQPGDLSHSEEFVPGGVACCDGTGCSECCDPVGAINRALRPACPRWIAQIDALMLWQGNIPSRPLLAGSGRVLDANDAQTLVGAGPRFGLFFNLDNCHAIEGNYFYVDGFEGDADLPEGDYSGVSLPVDWPADAGATLLTRGRLQSAELNWRMRSNHLVTWLVGFRWVEWNQELGLADDPEDVDIGLAARTGNDLYGGQIGLDVLMWDGPHLTVDWIGKAGVFGNRSFQETVDVAGGFVEESVYARTTTAAFFGEMGINANIWITDWLAWRTGYVFFWLGGAALPAENLSLVSFDDDSAALNVTESVLVHGVTTGLEARW